MKNTRIFCAASALNQPSASTNLMFEGFLRNSEYFYRNQCPEPNASGIIDFIRGNNSIIDTLYLSFTPVHCSVAGKDGSETRMILHISAGKDGKTISFFNRDEKIHTEETLRTITASLVPAIVRRVLAEFNWVEEYELDLSKIGFIGLPTFMDMKPNNLTYEEFVKTDSTLVIQPATPEDYLNGKHIASIRNCKRFLELSTFEGACILKLKF